VIVIVIVLLIYYTTFKRFFATSFKTRIYNSVTTA